MTTAPSLQVLSSRLSDYFGPMAFSAMPYDPVNRGVRDTERLTRIVMELASSPSAGVVFLGVHAPEGTVTGVGDEAERRARELFKALGAVGEFLACRIGDHDVLVVRVPPQTLPPRLNAWDLDLLGEWPLYVMDPDVAARVAQTAPRRGADDWDHEPALVGIGALDDSDGQRVPTIAGALALGGDPSHDLAGAVIVVDRGRGQEVLRGPVLEIVRRVACFYDDPNIIFQPLLNAFLHRDWSREWRDTPIQVDLARGGFEVRSPGLPIAADQPVRNRTLVDLARRARWCTGSRRTLATIRAAGHRVSVSAFGDFTRVCYERPTEHTTVARVSPPRRLLIESAAAPVAPTLRAVAKHHPPARSTPALDAREQAAVDLLARSPDPVSRQAIQDALGCSRTVVRTAIGALVKCGIVEAIEENPRSPTQAYRLRNEGAANGQG